MFSNLDIKLQISPSPIAPNKHKHNGAIFDYQISSQQSSLNLSLDLRIQSLLYHPKLWANGGKKELKIDNILQLQRTLYSNSRVHVLNRYSYKLVSDFYKWDIPLHIPILIRWFIVLWIVFFNKWWATISANHSWSHDWSAADHCRYTSAGPQNHYSGSYWTSDPCNPPDTS